MCAGSGEGMSQDGLDHWSNAGRTVISRPGYVQEHCLLCCSGLRIPIDQQVMVEL